MSELFRWAALFVGAGALIADVLRRRRAGLGPFAALVEGRFSCPKEQRPLVAAAFLAGAASVGLPVTIAAVAGWLRVGIAVSPAAAWLSLAAVTLVAKVALVVCEELIFRAALQGRLQRSLGVWPAVVIAALTFAAAHAGRPPLDVLVVGLDGVAFGVLFAATGSLLAPIAWHASKNVTVWLLGGGTVQFVEGPWTVVSAGPTLWLGSGRAGLLDLAATIVLVGSAVALLLVGGRVRRRESSSAAAELPR